MDRLTRFSLKNAAVVMIVTILATAGGLYYAGQLKRETMPDVTIPIVAIVTPYPGAAPADVHEKVTDPLEQAISRVEGLKSTSAMSNDSVSVLVAEFSYSADMEKAESDIQQALDGVDLPENVIAPETSRVSMGSQPILRFAVTGGDSAEELQAAVQDTLVPVLEAVDGVGEVSVSNETEDTIKIVFDSKALDEEGLTTQDVVQQLQAANLSFPVGSLEIDKVDQPVRVSGTLESVDAIRDFKVAVYPNANAMFADAFAAMGEGMGALGSAVGQMGGAMGQLGGTVGDLGAGMGDMAVGMGEMGQGLGMQIGLTGALQSVQSQSLQAKIQLSSAQSVMRDLESAGATTTPEYIAAQMGAAQLEAVIPALDQAAASIAAQIVALQQNVAAGAAAMPAMPSGSAEMPSMTAPSGGSASIDMDMEMDEPEIGLVRLGDIAKVTYGAEEGAVHSRANGQPAVLISIVKTQDANTIDVSEAVQQAANDGLADLPEGAEVTYTYDGAVMIDKSIDDMVQEGLLGALFAFIVILVFLRNIRSTLISAISIPLSIVLSLLAMKVAGVTMNVMTLGGLTVAIGRVVDDSIVVIENIFNHMQAGGERSVSLIRKATAEVSSAITSSTLTTVAVFAPMTLVSGIVGKIFTPFALTVAVALLSSLLVSLTIVPLLAKWSLLNAKVPHRDEQDTRTARAYHRALVWALDRPGVVVVTATLLFAGSLALVPIVGTGFMPPATEKYINVDVEYPGGFTATDVDAALRVLEAKIADREDVQFQTATVDTASGFNMAQGGVTDGKTGHIFVKLDDDGDVDDALTQIQFAAAPIEAKGGKITTSQVSMSGGSDNSVDIVVTGPMEGIESAVEKLLVELEDVDGLENVASNLAENRPQITAEVDQAKAAKYGLNAAMVAMTIRGYVAEQSAGFTQISDKDAEILYVTALSGVTSAKDIANRKLATPLGDEIRIGDVARVEETSTPVSILTNDQRQYASVTGSITTRDTSSVINAIQSVIDAQKMPAGVEVEIGGVAQMMSESFTQLGLAMLIAIAAVYLVMMLTFGEAIAPLAIMFSLPLAVIGGLIGLFIAGIPLDMPAMIGALMLIGIVTTNAIMFIERVNQRLAEGFERREALLDAGANRMRPILMTALTTIIALVPMASGFKSGALMSQSLAIVVVGGLTTSTVLTLIVVPVIYDLLEALKERIVGHLDSGDATA
ncbi:MAG: efflux RND transporter permease subunit [Actinomycetota bacterium]|nr:efflux RND transporter permease subunit [Actinomycetota bacterium]